MKAVSTGDSRVFSIIYYTHDHSTSTSVQEESSSSSEQGSERTSKSDKEAQITYMTCNSLFSDTQEDNGNWNLLSG